jgi:hypothetical protein
MDYIKSFFSKNTRRGRAVRTALQVLIAIFSFVVGLLLLPGLADGLQALGIGAQAAALATWAGIISYIWNALEGLLAWLDKE